MKSLFSQTCVLLLALLSLQPSAMLAQGSLTPPGAPAPTMKTLDQLGTNILQVSNSVAFATNRLVQLSNTVSQMNVVLQQTEPRYPISDFGTNLTLGGSYYLTTNLIGGTLTGFSASDGINVRTNPSRITIDLNGFSIISTNVAGPDSPVGVRISGATNVVVRNGQITDFDRAVRVEGPCYGIIVENIHAYKCRRSGIECDGLVSNPIGATVTIRTCVVDGIDATGEGGNAAADGIVLLNCSGVVDSCVVRDIVADGVGASSCISALSATNSFINNNFLADATVGLKITGGGTNRVIYRDNLTINCGTPISNSGGVDRGGNF